jgi:hypothetical protein
MKNKFEYQLKRDKVKVENISEKIYQNKDKLSGVKNITWETFTKDYLKLELPVNDVERLYWVNRRTVWVDVINKELLKNGYGCQLSVVPAIGVCLLTNGQAVSQNMTKRTRKISNTFNTTIELFESMKESFPEANKLIESFQRMTIDNLYAFSGRVDNSKLPRDIKRELKKILQKGLPASEE